jgi:hypothetical protein
MVREDPPTFAAADAEPNVYGCLEFQNGLATADARQVQFTAFAATVRRAALRR